MEMTPAQMKDIIKEAVTEAFKGHDCRFAVTEQEAKTVSMHVAEMRELGDGDLIRAMQIARDNHTFISEVRQKGDKISSVLFWSFVSVCGAGVAYGLWKAIKLIAAQLFIGGHTHG